MAPQKTKAIKKTTKKEIDIKPENIAFGCIISPANNLTVAKLEANTDKPKSQDQALTHAAHSRNSSMMGKLPDQTGYGLNVKEPCARVFPEIITELSQNSLAVEAILTLLHPQSCWR